ncbi:MAG: amidohydrolase family protein [Christensenellales bacterium]
MIDAHVHLLPGDPRPLLDRLHAFGAERFSALGVPAMWGTANNLLCLDMKRRVPGRAWAFGGLGWRGQSCPQPERQLALMLAAGFDGLKLIETKPNLQKQLAFFPDDPHFEGMFALAEARQVPIVWHVGDPAPFWHREQAPAFAVENGWLYDGPGFQPLEEIYRHTENVLQRHPGLHVVFAHLYFCSDDRDHLERLLAAWPDISLDITPGSEMYGAFSQDRAGWETFFKRFAGRILLGTDMSNAEPDSAWRELSTLTRGILRPEPLKVWDIQMQGFSLDEGERALVTGGNFIRLAGEVPKAINEEALAALEAFYLEQVDLERSPSL